MKDDDTTAVSEETLTHLLKKVTSTGKMRRRVPGKEDESTALNWAALDKKSNATCKVSEYRVTDSIVFAYVMVIKGHSKRVFALDIKKC